MITIICKLLHSDLTGQYHYTIHLESASQRLQLNRDIPLFLTMHLPLGLTWFVFCRNNSVWEWLGRSKGFHAIRKYPVRVPQITLLTSRFPHCLSFSFSAPLHFASMRFPLPPKTIILLTNN